MQQKVKTKEERRLPLFFFECPYRINA